MKIKLQVYHEESLPVQAENILIFKYLIKDIHVYNYTNPLVWPCSKCTEY